MELTEHPDWALILELGGPVKVAALLEWQKDGSAQRIQNWKHRGIPAAVKLARPDLFLPGLRKWDGKDRRKSPRSDHPTGHAGARA